MKILFVCFFVAVGGAVVSAADWPHWRGPNRSGVVAESSGWNDGAWPLEERWATNVGEGSTSPLVVGDRLYTMGWIKGRDRVVCLNAETGKQLWTVDYTSPRYGRLATGDQGIYSGTSSTPEYDSQTQFLYTLGIDGDLRCWDTNEQGRNVWKLNLYEEFDVPRRPKVGRSGRRDYGYTSSPLVYNDWLIVEVGAKQGTLIALDKRTGSVKWTSQADSPAGHNGGPVAMTVEGVPCVAVHNHDGLLVVRLDKGREGQTVATYPWETSFANNIATPTVQDNYVLLTSSYNQHRIAKLEVTLGGVKKVWEQKEASKVCSPVVSDGFVYWAWRKVVCLDFRTGKVAWQGGRVGNQGSVIATADGRIIVWTNKGDLLLVEGASRAPERYTELAARKGLGSSDAWPHVALVDGRLYCKDRSGNLECLEVQKRPDRHVSRSSKN